MVFKAGNQLLCIRKKFGMNKIHYWLMEWNGNKQNGFNIWENIRSRKRKIKVHLYFKKSNRIQWGNKKNSLKLSTFQQQVMHIFYRVHYYHIQCRYPSVYIDCVTCSRRVIKIWLIHKYFSYLKHLFKTKVKKKMLYKDFRNSFLYL